jgi:hypothetical protein
MTITSSPFSIANCNVCPRVVGEIDTVSVEAAVGGLCSCER